MSAVCGRHRDKHEHAGLDCAADLTFLTATDAIDENEAVIRLKRWLVRGYAIPCGDHDCRTKHMKGKCRARKQTVPLTNEEKDAAPVTLDLRCASFFPPQSTSLP